MNEIVKVFTGKKVRCFVIKGNPYFSVLDVCEVLEMSNSRDVTTRFDKDDVCITDVIDSMGRKQKLTIINEGALYQLIFRSRKDQAKDFKRWVTHEILPSIRKTGKYSIPDELKKMSTKKRNLLTEQWKNHGCNKPHHYSNLTKEEYKTLNINKKKAEMNKKELLLLSALETMEALKLLDRDDITGYYSCVESLKETGEQIKIISDNNKILSEVK